MREILFRGKRVDNGEWVEGCGIISTENWVSIFNVVDDIDENSSEVNEIEVIPETVGQYTGLTDKNGKKIFEGDIIHCVSKFDSADMVVVFECGQFRRILAEKYHEHQTNVGYYDINCFAKEVIGNIHDNLELLKRG